MTTWLTVKNNAQSALYAGITAAATSLTLLAGEGAKFPSASFNISIDDEILYCSTRTGDVLTVVRAQEGTTAAVHAVAATVSLNITAGIISQIQAAIDAGAGISDIDDFLDDSPVDGEVHKAPTSNALFDHAAAVSGVHSFGKACSVYNSAAQSIPDSAWTTITYNTEAFDTDNIHDLSTNTDRLTCKTAGLYLIIGLYIPYASTVGRRLARLRVNNSIGIGQFEFAVSSGGDATVLAIAVYNLAVNDYVQLQVYQSSGAALNAYGNSAVPFAMVRIG